jgi:hypothetical protein
VLSKENSAVFDKLFGRGVPRKLLLGLADIFYKPAVILLKLHAALFYKAVRVIGRAGTAPDDPRGRQAFFGEFEPIGEKGEALPLYFRYREADYERPDFGEPRHSARYHDGGKA